MHTHPENRGKGGCWQHKGSPLHLPQLILASRASPDDSILNLRGVSPAAPDASASSLRSILVHSQDTGVKPRHECQGCHTSTPLAWDTWLTERVFP